MKPIKLSELPTLKPGTAIVVEKRWGGMPEMHKDTVEFVSRRYLQVINKGINSSTGHYLIFS